MSVHYSDARGLSSGSAKRQVLDLLVDLISGYPPAQAVLDGHPCEADALALSWEDIDLALRSRTPPATAPASPTVVGSGIGQPVVPASRKRPPRLDRRPSHRDRNR